MAFYEGYGAPAPYATAAYGYSAPAPYAVPPMPGAYGVGAGAVDELRTVFLTGFPNDIKERELNNMLRFMPGYEASQMNWKNGQAQGFALFYTGAAARAACSEIAGLRFDEGVTLRAEMAHKNMYIKSDAAPNAGVQGKRMRTTGGYSGSYSGGGAGGSQGGGSSAGGGPVGYAPVSNTRDNPPCNTLFIGNLGDNVNEQELQGLFAGQQGFSQLKVLRNGRQVSCFVEFDTIEAASQCHTTQQGAVLTSSERGPIRIQFSKNPFGKKRDVSGQLIDTRMSAGGSAMDGMGAYDPTQAAV